MISAFAEQVIENTQGEPNTFTSFIPLVLIFIIFYFFIIRPQTKKQKEQQSLIGSIKKGDKVVFAGGLVGKVTNAKGNDYVEIEIDSGTNIKALKSSITSLVNTKPTDKK